MITIFVLICFSYILSRHSWIEGKLKRQLHRTDYYLMHKLQRIALFKRPFTWSFEKLLEELPEEDRRAYNSSIENRDSK